MALPSSFKQKRQEQISVIKYFWRPRCPLKYSFHCLLIDWSCISMGYSQGQKQNKLICNSWRPLNDGHVGDVRLNGVCSWVRHTGLQLELEGQRSREDLSVWRQEKEKAIHSPSHHGSTVAIYVLLWVLYHLIFEPRSGTVWPEKNCQMSIKVAQNDFTRKMIDFNPFTLIAWECEIFGQIYCCQRL